MIAFLLQHQALIRELINGVLFVLFLTLTLMITVFLWDTWTRVVPWSYQRWKQVEGVATSCVLWWLCGAEAYRTFNVWASYVQAKVPASASLPGSITGVGIFSASSVNSTVGYLAAGFILTLTLMRGIYIWTPPDWRRRVWIYAAVGAAVFVSLPTIFKG